jgi:hypothetical protein
MVGLITSEFSLVSRALSQPSPDNVEREQRVSRYGGTYIYNVVPTKHILADEGSYFVASNNQSALTGTTNTAFSATNPTISIFNSDSLGNPSSKRIYLDYVYLINGGTAFTNATSNTGTFCAVTIDSQDGATGGTLLTPNCTNMDVGNKSLATVRVGALTVPTASANARTIVGQRLVRCPVSATALTLANLDQFLFNFGGVDIAMALPNQASPTVEASVVGRTINLPPVVIGPGQSAWVYVFSVAGGAVAAGNFVPEIGWWER